MAAVETATLPRTFFDIRDMGKGYANNAYPYTLSVGLLNGLNESCKLLLEEGLENVFSRHHRIAHGMRAALSASGLDLYAQSPDLSSETVSAIRTPKGFNATDIGTRAADAYAVAFGVGLGEVAGKVFRVGHFGSLTDVMTLLGVATALEYYRANRTIAKRNRSSVTKDASLHIQTNDDMLTAHERLKPHIHRTPIRTLDYLNDPTGMQLFFKCENLQEVNSCTPTMTRA